MMNQITSFCSYSLRPLLIAACVLAVIGCQRDAGETPTSKKVPKLRFHCPNTYSAAVTRIREIHKILVSEENLPAPKSYQVVEFTHGEGAAAHSHFRLDNGADEDDHHSHGDETVRDVRRHKITIDIFTELKDIVRWLPGLAADSEMPREAWNSVNETSTKLEKILEPIVNDENSETQMRSDYRKHADASSQLIDKFESVKGNQTKSQ